VTGSASPSRLHQTLYSGPDSVRGGRFNFSFVVPKDINYADANGLISLYAVTNDRTQVVNGSTTNIVVGGTDAIGTDTICPKIYCYLNTTNFVNGGNVNTTPYFVAQLTDASGINATGNGVGHDLELIMTTATLQDLMCSTATSPTTSHLHQWVGPTQHSRAGAWQACCCSSGLGCAETMWSTAKHEFNVVKSLMADHL
jgi:hypothetical protein